MRWSIWTKNDQSGRQRVRIKPSCLNIKRPSLENKLCVLTLFTSFFGKRYSHSLGSVIKLSIAGIVLGLPNTN